MNRCHNMTLAHCGNSLIDYCADCQVMHLHIDAVTLKLQRESLAALGDLIQQALSTLQRLENDSNTLLQHLIQPRQPPH